MHQTRSVMRRARAAVGRTPLLVAVILAVAGGLAIAAAAGWVAVVVLGTKNEPAAPLDITKVALVVAGGVGGAVALVVAYRRQRDLESARFIERFGAAATQLGSPYTAVRIAGVYAMAGVADESADDRRQQCIDVLCGYLRLPYSPDTGANHQTGRDRKDTSTTDIEVQDHFQYLQNDKVVRQTIVRVIATHLRDHDHNWSTNNFDFTTAHFENADFREATFSGTAWFSKATFSGDTRFDEATFSGDTEFKATTFSGDPWFDKATFSGDAWFGEARFSGDARFRKVRFSGIAWFDKATFSGDAWFDKATFASYARFYEATFSGNARFDTATFSSTARFSGATFDAAGRMGAIISFRHVDFGSGVVSFDNPRRWGPPTPQFDWDAAPFPKPANVSPTPWPPTPAS